MKKMILMILMIFSSFLLQAPPLRIDEKAVEQWKQAEEIWYWQPLIEAVVWVESRGDTFAYNEKENACGLLQIRQIKLDWYFNRTGIRYELKDCFKESVSKEIFMYHIKQYSDANIAIKKWNGSGPPTEIYWQKIKLRLKQSNHV